jgi:hypothetical protein
MSSPTFIYEDEILPEIEIRELLSLEQVLENNPTFIAFTREEMLEHLFELIPETKKTAAFVDAIIGQTKNMKQLDESNIVPVLRAGRKDTSLEEDASSFYQEYIAAPNYKLQQNMLSTYQYPLEQVLPSNSSEGTFVPSSRVHVGLNSGTHDISVVLAEDDVRQALIGATYNPPTCTSESFLCEKVGAQTSYPNDLPFIETADIERCLPSFDKVLEGLTQIPDIHELRVVLSRYNFNFDELSNQQLRKLVKHIRGLPVEEEEDRERRSSRSQKVTALDWQDFGAALSQYTQLVSSYDKTKYDTIYNALVSSLPPQSANVDVPLNAADIAQGLRTNQFTFDDVYNFLKMMRNKYIVDEAVATLKRYMSIDPEAIPDTVQASIEKWQRRLNKYQDRTAKTFLDIYRDIADIKQGTDTSKYDGNPKQEQYGEYEEIQHEYVPPLEDDDDMDVSKIKDDEDVMDVDMSTVTEGQQEVLIPVLRKFKKIANASGLPCNFQGMVAFICPRVIRISFKETLMQYVPELAESVRTQLSSGNYEAAMRFAMSIVPTELGERAQTVVRQMYKEYRDTLKKTFLQCFAWFLLEIQEAALEKRLNFDPMSGMLTCVQQWTPFGPPLVKDKDSEGALYYMSCVAHETGVVAEFQWKAEDVMKHTIAVAMDEMNQRVEGLRAKWTHYTKENTQTISKARQANLSLAEAIQMKLKKRVLPDFVKAFLYIPGMISSSKHPSFAVGCCMQQLGADFKADSDWQEMKKLKGVKDQFAKKRMTKVERPGLAWLDKKARKGENTTVSTQFYVPREIPRTQDVNLLTWLTGAQSRNLYLLPSSIIQSLINDPLSVNNTIIHNVRAFLKTCNKKSPSLEEVIIKGNDTSMPKRILDIVATTLQAQRQLQTEGSIEHNYVQSALTHIIDIKKCISTLKGVFDDVDSNTILYMYKYIVSAAICLPASTLDTVNNKLVLTDRVRSSFLTDVLSDTFNRVQKCLSTSIMPSIAEQQAFITKMREVQKIETLKLLNAQTEDDRQLMIEAKNLGLLNMRPLLPTEEEQEVTEEVNNTYEEEGENEFRYAGEDPEHENDNELGI